MSECLYCDGTGFVVVERRGMTAVKPCVCRGAIAEKQTPLSAEEASRSLGLIFQLLDFSPPSEPVRAILLSGFRKMCATLEQAKYIIERVPQFHTKWTPCGLPGLRQILCQRYTPKDGLVLNSTDAYPEGLPPASSKPQAAQSFQIEPGDRVTADPRLENGIRKMIAPPLVGMRKLVGTEIMISPGRPSPEERRREKAFERELENVITWPDDRPPEIKRKPVRQSEIQRANAEPDPVDKPLPEGAYQQITRENFNALLAAELEAKKKKEE